MKKLAAVKLADTTAEQVRRDHHDAIVELQQQPLVGGLVVADVVLADGVATRVPHKLGRAPIFVKDSCPRGAASNGRVDEIRDGTDRAKAIVLKASGWGASITVDVVVA